MATPFRLKRSSVTGKRPALSDVQIGELAFNFYDGHLFAERDTGGVGIATTVALLTPWIENFGGGSITYSGIVTANTYHGNQVIGTPAGGFKTGAFTINNTDHTKDSINELNFILGKLVPDSPDTFDGLALVLTGTAGVGRLCAGFTATNNTGGAAPNQTGTQYTRNTDSTIQTNYINDVGPGDAGTVTGFVNAVGVGTTTLDTGTNNATSGAVQINDNKDASESTRNTGITSQFYQTYDVRLINAASPDGFNKAFLTHGSATTGEVFWYEDPSTVGAPVISFSGVTEPSSPLLNYSSGIPHYTQASANNFTYVLTVTNASGDMYTQNTFLTQSGNDGGNAFANSGNKSYTNFASGTNPPAQNYGVGTGVTTLITNTFKDIHSTITSNHFSRYDASTPYGSHINQRISFSTPLNVMGTTAKPNQIDEDSITNFGANDGVRVKAGSAADNPSATFVAWTGSSGAGSIDTYEATVRGGVLRHDQTNYSTGYLPVGPNYSVGRSGAQYYQVLLDRDFTSSFNIVVTGSYGGCWVCMPDNPGWNTSLSGTNGWADMFTAYRGSGVPTTAQPGCAVGTVMSGSSGTFNCTFGTESTSNASSPYRILIRWRLDAGDSITAMSYTT